MDTSEKPEHYDPATRFMFVPRTITALLVGAAGLVWCSGALQRPPVDEANYPAGFVAMAAAYVAYSALQGPSSVMTRPHPAAWRVVHGACMVYLLALIFLLMQGKSEARQLLKHLDPSLGKPLEEREYGTDCRLWTETGVNFTVISDTVFDVFVIAHVVGWWAKALIMRNYWLLWTCSFGFELMELTFQHWLLNFNECWWDSWVLDVAVCNLAGMLAGMATVHFFGSKHYNWQGTRPARRTLLSTARQGLLQFTPVSLELWNWATFSSPKRFLLVLALVCVIMVCELNAFFLKTLLWIPPPNKLNVARLVLLGLLALPGVKEYHEFVNGDAHDVFLKLGPFAWLAAAIVCVEVLNVMKLGQGEFTEPFPPRVVAAWGICTATLACVLVVWQIRIWIARYQRRATGPLVPPRTKAGSKAE